MGCVRTFACVVALVALSLRLSAGIGVMAVPDGTEAATAAPCPKYPFYWNVGDDTESPDLTAYSITAANYTHTGDGGGPAGCTPAWEQGKWPTIAPDGKMTNGGVPQAGNLSAHLDAITEQIDCWIPDPAWDGNAVFDFESWTPVWAQNLGVGTWHSIAYQLQSEKLVRAAHPTWNSSQVNAEAAKQFETAATNWMVQTLLHVRKLRPNVKTGFYGLPANPFYPCVGQNGPHPECGYECPVFGKIFSEENDAIQALWNASTALFPSMYVPPDQKPLATQSYINGTVAEAVRLSKATGRDLPVYAFMWSYYHNGTTHLDPQDLHSSLALPFYHGADGVVIWGDPREHEADFKQYLATQLGPSCAALSKQFCS